MPEAPPAVGSAIVAQSVGRNNGTQLTLISRNKCFIFTREAPQGFMSAEVFGQYSVIMGISLSLIILLNSYSSTNRRIGEPNFLFLSTKWIFFYNSGNIV